ncbi:MAG: ABC transporter ATP-binding protein [Acidimicrobiia bacterium]|nr:ABC transporter ATP-binding protein [Acidimicrobiia bacterium]
MLQLRDLTVRYGSFTAVDRIDLDIPTGSVVALLGPSGSGKSTLLRAIAGLERPATGSITWKGDDMVGVPVHRRPFGMMFQDYALFPHLSVARNVSFGLEATGADDVARRVEDSLALVGLTGLGERPITALSGGEQQRVAFARTLATRPELIMLDEPLGALDRELRERLLREMSDVFRRLGQTVVYVTHDQEEAFAVADTVVVLERGRVVQAAAPDEMWEAPASEFVARFLGFTVVNVTVGEGRASSPWGTLPCSLPSGHHRAALLPDAVSPGGEVDAVVTARSFAAGRWRATVLVGQGPLLDVTVQQRPEIGSTLRIAVDPDGWASLGEPRGDYPTEEIET